MNYVNLDKLTKWKDGANRGNVNWDESVGSVVDFKYNGIYGEFKIVGRDKQEILIEYNDKKISISSKSIKSCSLKSLFFKPIIETDPWMVDLGMSLDDAKKYSIKSTKKVKVNCPKCGRSKYIIIQNMSKRMRISCVCDVSSMSFPERLILGMLEHLNINYIHQFSSSDCEWCENYRYDFYIPSLNCIIESHGGQHYKETSNFEKTLDEIKANDISKKMLAIDNGINKYITIDCSDSYPEYIIKNILDSELSKIICIDDIDWKEVSLKSMSGVDCNILNEWNSKEESDTTQSIADKIGLSRKVVLNTLKKYKYLDLCDYDSIAESEKTRFKPGGISTSKSVDMYKDGIFIARFISATDLSRKSEELFGVKLDNRGISEVCTGKIKTHKGFKFKYSF